LKQQIDIKKLFTHENPAKTWLEENLLDNQINDYKSWFLHNLSQHELHFKVKDVYIEREEF